MNLNCLTLNNDSARKAVQHTWQQRSKIFYLSTEVKVLYGHEQREITQRSLTSIVKYEMKNKKHSQKRKMKTILL